MAKKEKPEVGEPNNALAEAIARIRKQYGEGAIIQDDVSSAVEAIPTGCFTIDEMLGCGGLPKGRIIEIYGAESCQPKGSKVLMANGEFKNVEDISVGDLVVSPQKNGKTAISSVVHTTSWTSPYIYTISKTNGDILYRCSGNHIIPNKRWRSFKIKNSRDSMHVNMLHEDTAQDLHSNYSKEHGMTVFTTSEIDWGGIHGNDPVIGGYTLGLCLANGHFPLVGGVKITMHEDDAVAEIERMRSEGSVVSDAVKCESKKTSKAVTSTLSAKTPHLPQHAWIKLNNLCGKTAHTKFIPKEALFSTIQYRKNLLAGLLDGDGSLTGNSNTNNVLPRAHWEYSTVSKQLADDVKFLVHSLGGYCNISERITHCMGKPFTSFRLYISMNESIPVALKRKFGHGLRNKSKNLREKLATEVGFSIQKDNVEQKVYGFTLDSDSQWYVTDNFVVTHNSGKSSMCLFFASQVQKHGGTVAYLDAENAYDSEYAAKFGVDTKKMLVSQPGTLEETFDILMAYAATNAVDLIIVDSVAALTPKSELEGDEMLKDTMAVQARLMSKALRIVTGPISRSKTVVIFINQLREKVGLVFGEKMTTPGGKALKYYASVRLMVSRGEKYHGAKGEQIGNLLKITAVKNKVGAPYRTGEVALYYGTGLDLQYDVFVNAVERDLIKKTGNTYSFNDKKLGVGTDASVEFLKNNKDVYEEIYKELKK